MIEVWIIPSEKRKTNKQWGYWQRAGEDHMYKKEAMITDWGLTISYKMGNAAALVYTSTVGG